DGLFLNQNVFLEDKLTGQIHDLKSSSYNFTSSIGTFTDRFVIRFTNNTVNTKNFIAADESMVQITSSNERLTVKSAKESLKTVAIYDQTGRLLYQKEKVIQTVLTIPLQKSNQILIAKIELENGEKLTKKIVF
ncbi:MAG: T9SS sorting signal type C domain-containing protein, partial [Flavobacteriaceae bacterium]|nr:T9SS sorting signal type C domain-containing protein [Flavobacteriaceae bacterium]